MARILFFVVSGLVVFALQISILRSLPFILAYLLFILFFYGGRESLILAFLLGLLQDLFSPTFGFFSLSYAIIFFILILLAHTIITNKSLTAFTLLGILGFVLYELDLIVIPFFGSLVSNSFYSPIFSKEYFVTILTSFGWYLVLLWISFLYEAKKRIF